MTIVIKRYPNRKLYDTIEKQYITLERIAELIRQGEEVHVVDNATGEDLTAVTLTQIIFELEKKQAGFLPMPVLAGLVQAGGSTLDAVRRTLSSPLDLLRHLDDEISRRLDMLVNDKIMTPDQAAVLLEQLVRAGRQRAAAEHPSILDKTVGKFLVDRGVPSRDDFNRLLTQLDTLNARVEELQTSPDKTPPTA